MHLAPVEVYIRRPARKVRHAPHVKLQTDRLAEHLAESYGWSVPKQGGERPDVLVLSLATGRASGLLPLEGQSR